jgi:glucose/arabinose dehydrogenase
MKKVRSLRGVVLSIFVFGTVVFSQGVPAPFTIRLQPFLRNQSRPILVRHDGPGPGKKIFTVEQTGIIKIIVPGASGPADFINLSSRIIIPSSQGSEQGLLGMAVPANFETTGKFYVNYTRSGDGATVIAEFSTMPGNPNQGDPNSFREILRIPQPFANHNGGMIEFGRAAGDEGNLYIGMGDGGSANDPGNRAQNPSVLLGKMLRINPLPDGVNPYSIPAGNPFTGFNTSRCDGGSTTAGTTCQEIWTIGMRNPWRWSFDRQTNDLWVADVGQGSIEEIDRIESGRNYGWRVYEGSNCTNVDPTLCTTPPNPIYTMPLFQYGHSGGRCSMTGGYVYRGVRGSLPAGNYVFGDYCSGEIFLWNRDPGQTTPQILLDTPRFVTSFGEDEDGEVYICYSNSASDTVSVSKITRAKASADFDGDLKTDLSVFRPSIGVWYVNHSSNGTNRIQQFGINGDIPTPEDWDGDNISDLGVFRGSEGVWYHFRSSDNTVGAIRWGATGDVPVAADYDGDAKADFAIFRPSTGLWYIYYSTPSATPSVVSFGLNGDVPTVGDYDADGKADISIFRPSSGDWWWSLTAAPHQLRSLHWGANGDIPAAGDFDGDFKTDFAVFRPSNGVWYVLRSLDGSAAITNWGLNGDIPTVGDYDGDGKDDIAVFRPSNGVWYSIRSSNGAFGIGQYGLSGDQPAPAYDAP